MVPKINKAGRSFAGAGAYYLHDRAPKGEAKRDTTERVAWTHTVNCAHDEPKHALEEMWQTARHQQELRRESGHRASKRTQQPVMTLALAWAPSEQPTREHMIETAQGFLADMGWQDHQALVVAHTDRDHPHIHLIINRVHPDTGMTMKSGFEHRRAQAWALTYEREHGKIWCVQRDDNARARDAGEPARDNRSTSHDAAFAAKESEQPAHAAEAALAEVVKSDKDVLSDYQTQQREAYIAASKGEIKDIRTDVFLEVREEFKPQWRALFEETRAAGTDEKALHAIAEKRAALWQEVKSTTREWQDEAVKTFIAERREGFGELKEQQKEERAELRDILSARDDGKPYDVARLAELTGERPDPIQQANAQLAEQRSANDNTDRDAPSRAATNDNTEPQREAVNEDPRALFDPASPMPAGAEKAPMRDAGDGLAGGIGAIAEKIADALSSMFSPPTPQEQKQAERAADRAEKKKEARDDAKQQAIMDAPQKKPKTARQMMKEREEREALDEREPERGREREPE